MKTKSLIFSLALTLMSAVGAQAQVTIGSLEEPNATLDVRKGTEKADGIIAPVLTGDELANNDAKYGTGQTGAIVYVTAAPSVPTAKTGNITAAGYYYFDGTVWQLLKGENGSEVDGIVGNEIVGAANETLVVTGSGSDADPHKIARAAISGDVSVPAGSNEATLKAVSTTANVSTASPAHGGTFTAIDNITTDGKGRVTAVNTKTVTLPSDANTIYEGSTSVILNGSSFQRAALSGDVTASQNDNTTTIAANAVTSTKIKDGEVATVDLAADAVTSAKIANGTIVTDDLANNSVTSAKIVNSTILSEDLADSSVTSAKIKDGEVKTDDLAASAVTSAKIADGTIVNADIADKTIEAGKIKGTTNNGYVLTSDASGNASWQTKFDLANLYKTGDGASDVYYLYINNSMGYEDTNVNYNSYWCSGSTTNCSVVSTKSYGKGTLGSLDLNKDIQSIKLTPGVWQVNICVLLYSGNNSITEPNNQDAAGFIMDNDHEAVWLRFQLRNATSGGTTYLEGNTLVSTYLTDASVWAQANGTFIVSIPEGTANQTYYLQMTTIDLISTSGNDSNDIYLRIGGGGESYIYAIKYQ